MAAKETLNQTFETALEQLEQIVEQLESGELSLEDSLAAFGFVPDQASLTK